MGLTAYGDESIRRRDVTDPVYLLGAYIEPVEGGEALVGALGALRYRGKLHWRDSLPRDKKRVCRLIGEHAGQHLVVAVAPLADGRREERARQQALMTLSVVLAADYRVDRLVLEARQRNQDAKDEATVAVGVRSGILPDGFTVRHRPGQAEARLWIPDQVVGAYGDAETGDHGPWDLLRSRVRVERIRLSR